MQHTRALFFGVQGTVGCGCSCVACSCASSCCCSKMLAEQVLVPQSPLQLAPGAAWHMQHVSRQEANSLQLKGGGEGNLPRPALHFSGGHQSTTEPTEMELGLWGYSTGYTTLGWMD